VRSDGLTIFGAVGGIVAELLCASAGAVGMSIRRLSATAKNGFTAKGKFDRLMLAIAPSNKALRSSGAGEE
jgi:hypothetical protein